MSIADKLLMIAKNELRVYEAGKDGTSDRIFIRYSANADGTDFTEEWSEGQNYIGFAVAKEVPTDKNAYEWSKFVGSGGSALDLSEYINKNNLGSAFRIASDGNLNLVGASKAQIDNQINAQNPIIPSTISYAVKVGLTANTETLTDEEKDKARNWLGISTEKEITDYIDKEIAEFDFVKVVDVLPETGLPNREYFVRKNSPDTNDLFDEYAWINSGTDEQPIWGWEFKGTKTMEIDLSDYIKKSSDIGGGLYITGKGQLAVLNADATAIDKKRESARPITPNYLDYAVKVALTTNSITLTDEEKAAVCAWIGANSSGGYTVRIECEPNRAPIYISKHFPTSPDDYDAVLPMSEDTENQYLTLTDVKQLWFWDAESLPGLCATSNGRYLFYNHYTDYCGFNDDYSSDDAVKVAVKAVYKNTFRVFEDMTVYITHVYE